MTRHRLLIALVLFVLLPGIPPRLAAQELPFVHYTTESELHPLPSSTVYTMMQDRTGFLWLCVYGSGMVRYDGQSMDLFTPEDGLVGTTVMCALQDQAGRLWVATDVGICVSEEPLETYTAGRRMKFSASYGGVSLAQTSISQVAPNCLTMDRAGAIYLATTGLGVVRYRLIDTDLAEADTLPTDYRAAGTNNTVFVVLAAYDGTIWAGVDGGLMRLDRSSGRFIPFAAQSGVPVSAVHALAEMSDGSLWGGCENGLVWKLEEVDGRKRITTVMNRLTGVVYGLVEEPRGTVWVASHNSGIMELDLRNAGANRLYTRQNGLLGNNVRNMMADREGNLWITQTGGVSKLRRNFRAFSYITANAPAGSPALLPVPETMGVDPPNANHSLLWVCTGGGVTAITPDGRSATIGVADRLSSGTTYDVHVDSKSRIWIGTFNGLNAIAFDEKKLPPLRKEKPNTVRFLGLEASMAFYDIGIVGVCNAFAMITDTAGATAEAVWFNGYRRVVCLVNDEWFVFDEGSGLPASIMYALAVDRTGYVYIGTGDKGLYRSTIPLTLTALRSRLAGGEGFAGREIRSPVFAPHWNTSNGAPTNEIEEVLWIDSTLWVGTSAAVFRLDGGSVASSHPIAPGPGQSVVEGYCGTYDPTTRSVWFGYVRGLTQISLSTGTVVRTITKEGGLLNNETNWLEGLGVGPEGEIYCSHPSGMTVYRPSLDTQNDLPPPLVLKSAVFLERSAGGNELAVEYAALSFTNERMVRYRTRLIGYDHAWSPPTADIRQRYTNLSAWFFDKRYVFEVTASNDAGVWRETPVRFEFLVSPPLWFRWWAFLIYALIVGILIQAGRWLAANLRVIIASRRSRYISHFRLHERLGEGGMGIVYRAIDLHTKTPVAVKLLKNEVLADHENRRRLAAEGRLLASIVHPHIVRVMEVGETESQGFIVMEYLTGGTLQQYLRSHHPLPIAEVRRLAMQICLGIRAVHERQIIHRDIKTGNVMLDDAGNIHIMDFGLSKSPLVTTMTTMGTVLGTLGFTAPEQITNQQVDARTDIFSFGVLLHELLTNELPFRGENEIALIHAIFNTQPPLPSTLRADIPAAFDRIVLTCLAKQPDERFASVTEIETVLQTMAV